MCLCKGFLCGCVHANACLCVCVHTCVHLDRARRWRVVANFESSYKILTEVFVKYSFVSVKPEGHVGEKNRQIAFTPVNVTLEA